MVFKSSTQTRFTLRAFAFSSSCVCCFSNHNKEKLKTISYSSYHPPTYLLGFHFIRPGLFAHSDCFLSSQPLSQRDSE